MTTISHFFAKAELDKCMEWAIERHESHNGAGNRRVDPNSNDIDMHYLGIRGEYAVWKHFHGKWNRFWENGIPPKWDIERGPFRCEVKTTKYRNGRFIIKPWEKLLADVGYLVTAGPGLDVTIVGCITREQFYTIAKPTPLGHKEIPLAVSQSELMDPQTFFID